MAEKAYTLFLHDGSKKPPVFEIDFFESPDAARAKALKLLADRPRYTAIEVSDALTSFRVERPPA
jgi:hypothetical protein